MIMKDKSNLNKIYKLHLIYINFQPRFSSAKVRYIQYIPLLMNTVNCVINGPEEGDGESLWWDWWWERSPSC